MSLHHALQQQRLKSTIVYSICFLIFIISMTCGRVGFLHSHIQYYIEIHQKAQQICRQKPIIQLRFCVYFQFFFFSKIRCFSLQISLVTKYLSESEIRLIIFRYRRFWQVRFLFYLRRHINIFFYLDIVSFSECIMFSDNTD